MQKIYREKEIRAITGLSRVTRWRWVKEGNFPQPIQLGPNSIGWLASDVEAWIKEKKNYQKGEV